MKQLFITVALLAALTGCNSGGEKKEGPKTDTTAKTEKTPASLVTDTAKTAAPAATDFPADFKPAKIFKADKADLHESLEVQQLTEKKIAYQVKMENGGCSGFTQQGIAILKEGDAESDTDEKGNGYFVAEYVDEQKGACTLYIRIGVDKGYTNRAKFYVADCTKACKDKADSEVLMAAK